MGEEVLQETIIGCQCGKYGFLFMAIGLIHAPIASHPYMRRTYNKHLGNFLFSSFYSNMIHCRMMERNYLDLEIVLYTWIDKPLYGSALECEVGRIWIMYLDPMLEKGKFGAYMKKIKLTLFGIFSKCVTNISKDIRSAAPCR